MANKKTKEEKEASKIKKEKKPQKKREPMKQETKDKIREARRNRTKQPREGQSKKSKSFYSVMLKDYGKLAKENEEVKRWLEENKEAMKEMGAAEAGVISDYEEMYISWREFKMSKIHYGKNAVNLEENLLKEDEYAFIDLDEERVYEEIVSEDVYIEYD